MRTVATIIALLALAGPASAEPVALLDAPRAQAVALAGREVAVAGTRPGARVTVDAVAVDTGTRRRVLAGPSPGRGWSANLRRGASAQRIALLAAYEDDEGNPRRYRLLGGPPSGPLAPVLSAHPARRTAWIPLEIDVDADRVLVAELRFSDLRSRLRVLAPDGTATTVPWPGIALPPARLHGDRVAFVGAPQRDPEGPIDDVVVLDWRSGAVAATLGIGDPDDVREEDLDLAGDGRTIAAVRGRLQLAAPGAGITPLAPDTPATWAAPRFAGAGIAALRGLRSGAREPVVLEPGARARGRSARRRPSSRR